MPDKNVKIHWEGTCKFLNVSMLTNRPLDAYARLEQR